MWYKTTTGKPVQLGVVAKDDLGFKKTGEVVHKPTGAVVGKYQRLTHTPVRGVSTYPTFHVNGTQVYTGTLKRQALVTMATYLAKLVHQETQGELVQQAEAASLTKTVYAVDPASSTFDVVQMNAKLNAAKQQHLENLQAKAPVATELSTWTKPVTKAVPPDMELVNGKWVVMEEPPQVTSHGVLTVRPGEKCGAGVPVAIAHPTLSDEEREAVKAYTGNAYVKMNKFAMAGYTFQGAYDLTEWEMANLERLVRALRDATRRALVTHPVAVLRSVPGATASQVFGPVGSRVGQAFVERRFSSTTKLPKDLGFGDVRLEYHLSPQACALDVHHLGVTSHASEHEVILAPEQRFRVVADVVTTRRVITLESA